MPSRVGPDAGQGLIACVTYQPGDYITWYDGDLLYCHPSKLTKAEKSYALQWEKNCCSLVGIRESDLAPGRGLGSFANDRNLSKGSGDKALRKKNNARFSLPDKDNSCCWVIADCLIERDEVTVSYGPGYRL